MFRLLALLSAALFLTMLIGGQDRGQLRFGLMDRPDDRPRRPVAVAQVEEPIRVSTFVPVAAPTAAVAMQDTSPVTLVAAAVAAEPVAALPTFAAEPEATVQTVAASADEATVSSEIRYVRGDAINVRSGPSIGDPVIGRLTRNEAVSVVGDGGGGWTMIRIEGDGIEGFVASRLLTTDAPLIFSR